jgi:ribulose-5-phosphate 4-epimerase/fuculose-1-phosphate aldolase
VGGVVHTHSLHATAFACTGREIPVISTELAGLVGASVPCAPYAPAGTERLAQAAADALGEEGAAVLLQNHGAVAVGETLERAYAAAVAMEVAAHVYLLARQLGEPIVLPPEERRRIFRSMRTGYGQPREA